MSCDSTNSTGFFFGMISSTTIVACFFLGHPQGCFPKLTEVLIVGIFTLTFLTFFPSFFFVSLCLPTSFLVPLGPAMYEPLFSFSVAFLHGHPLGCFWRKIGATPVVITSTLVQGLLAISLVKPSGYIFFIPNSLMSGALVLGVHEKGTMSSSSLW